MSLFRSLINRVWNKSSKESLDVKKPQSILLKPDGTWSISSTNTQQITPPKIVSVPPPMPGKDYMYYGYERPSELELLSFPPDYFPHAKELYSKLEKCLELDVILSCSHKQTPNSVYILSVELPWGKEHSENNRRIRMFVSAMEESYQLKAIQQERINSTTCADKHYLVIFEYDPRRYMITTIKTGK